MIMPIEEVDYDDDDDDVDHDDDWNEILPHLTSLLIFIGIALKHIWYGFRLTWVQYKKIFLEPSADNPKGVDDDDHDDFGGLKEQADNGQRLSRLRKRVTF